MDERREERIDSHESNFAPMSTNEEHTDNEEEEEENANSESVFIRRRKDVEYDSNRFKFKPFDDQVLEKNILTKFNWQEENLKDLNWNELSDLRDLGEAQVFNNRTRFEIIRRCVELIRQRQ